MGVGVTLRPVKEAAKARSCSTYLRMPPILALLNHSIGVFSGVCGR